MLAYPRIFKHTKYGFDPNGQRIVCNKRGRTLIRILWRAESDEAVVVFKGSHSITDWLLNLALWQVSCKPLALPYKIHAGYYRLLNQESEPSRNEDSLGASVLQRLEQYLEPLILSGKRVALTGHSSGGAMACVAADYLERRYPRSVKRVVTFGQPALGGWSFYQGYGLKNRTYRICCDIDIVTFMPPIPLYYLHVGKALWLYNGKIYENTPTLVRLLRSISSWIIRPFTYHLMSKYIRNKDFFDER